MGSSSFAGGAAAGGVEDDASSDMVNVVLFGVKSKEEEYKKIEKEQDTKQEAEWIGRRCCVGTVIGRGESKQFFPTKSRILFSLISTVVHSSTV